MGSSLCRRYAYLLSIGLIALVPMVEALSCVSFVSHERDICEDILGSDAPESYKAVLIANIRNQDPSFANHTFVDGWNRGIVFTNPPSGVETRENGIIKEAWQRIVAISPSVELDGETLTSGVGSLQSAYNYRIEIPSGKEGNDCQTDFSLISNNPQLSNYLNGRSTGLGTYVPFSEGGNLAFRTVLDITANLKVVHYKSVKYCCRRGSGGCAKYCTRCERDREETRSYSVQIEDHKDAITQWNVIQPKMMGLDEYLGTTKGFLNISKETFFKLNYGESNLEHSTFQYQYNVTMKPYEVISITAIPSLQKASNDMIVEEEETSYTFSAPTSNDCSITFGDHFHSWTMDCDLSINGPVPKIETDKLQYGENEDILVDIEPKGTPLSLSYGNESIIATNTATFKAKPQYNSISASIDGRQNVAFIHVRQSDVTETALNFGVFFTIVGGYWVMIRKVWGL